MQPEWQKSHNLFTHKITQPLNKWNHATCQPKNIAGIAKRCPENITSVDSSDSSDISDSSDRSDSSDSSDNSDSNDIVTVMTKQLCTPKN